MACYFIVNVLIPGSADRRPYDGYIAAVKPIVESYGGRYLVRTERIDSFEEGDKPDRIIVVRFPDGETVYVGKLIVRPDRQGQGIGTKLLLAIERYFPQKRFELFTSTRSTLNIKLYERLGYKRYKEVAVNEDLSFVYMEKKK